MERECGNRAKKKERTMDGSEKPKADAENRVTSESFVGGTSPSSSFIIKSTKASL